MTKDDSSPSLRSVRGPKVGDIRRNVAHKITEPSMEPLHQQGGQ